MDVVGLSHAGLSTISPGAFKRGSMPQYAAYPMAQIPQHLLMMPRPNTRIPAAVMGPTNGLSLPGMSPFHQGSLRTVSSPPQSAGSSPSPGSLNDYSVDKLSRTNLYIRGLPSETTDSDLNAMCRDFGQITSTKAIMDKSTNKCKGYGFVDFENPHSAKRAVHGLLNRGIQAHMARQQEQDTTNLYFSNLPKDLTEDQLEQRLKDLKVGTIVSTRILRDTSNDSRGVGFARLESKEKCDQVIRRMNGKKLPGSVESLVVKFADSGAKRKKQYQQQQFNVGQLQIPNGEGLTLSYDPSLASAGNVMPYGGNNHVLQGMLQYSIHNPAANNAIAIPGMTFPMAHGNPGSSWIPGNTPYILGNAQIPGASLEQLGLHMSQLPIQGNQFLSVASPGPAQGFPIYPTGTPPHLLQEADASQLA